MLSFKIERPNSIPERVDQLEKCAPKSACWLFFRKLEAPSNRSFEALKEQMLRLN